MGNKDILAVLTWLQNNSIIWNSNLNAEIIKLLNESQRLSPDTNSYEGMPNFKGLDYEVHDLRTFPMLEMVAFGEKLNDDH